MHMGYVLVETCLFLFFQNNVLHIATKTNIAMKTLSYGTFFNIKIYFLFCSKYNIVIFFF